MFRFNPTCNSSLALFGVFCLAFVAQPVSAQTSSSSSFAPITLRSGLQLAQAPPREAVPNPTIIPTDVTPIGIGQEREMLRPGYSYYLLQKLPPKLWLNASVEASQRLETNVFFTRDNHKQDYVFRAQPNITLGYKILPRTSIYANWFLIKDVFADHGNLTYPTFQSVSGGLQHDIPIKSRTNLQLNYQIRELWQDAGLRQADMIPGATLTHAFSPKFIGFANLQLQMRSRNIFQGPTREIDPFYTIGALYRWKSWTFVATDTFVSNYRQPDAIPSQSNLAMIADFEVARPITKKIPSLVAFVRAEPIWNWNSNSVPGLSGFDFRLFSGLRWTVSKNPYDNNLSKMKRMLQEGGPTGSNSDPAIRKRKTNTPANTNQAPATNEPAAPAANRPANNSSDDSNLRKPEKQNADDMENTNNSPVQP